MEKKYHLSDQKIPEGFQIFEERAEVMGVKYRKEDAASFALSKDQWLEFERDPENQYDGHAIEVIGCSKGFFGTKRGFMGYVPKEVARAIVEGGFWGRKVDLRATVKPNPPSLPPYGLQLRLRPLGERHR